MTNMNEKLELMKWLYENGVEPRYYYEEDAAHGRNLIDGDYARIELKHCLHEFKPYHPLEQVLEELPNEINYADFKMNDESIGYGGDGYYAGDWDWSYREDRGDDIHLAALRLLKRVREGEKK